MITVGVDEVGRGCWAGPLVAAAVALPPGFALEDGPVKLRDSKKLSKMQREKADIFIRENAMAIGIGWVTAAEVDSYGVTEAVRLAMERAVHEIKLAYDELIIDGNINYFPQDYRAKAIIKADDSVPAVSAASIIAKVARDTYMTEAAGKHPAYGFEKHVGYGTGVHIAALRLHGICDEHRKSYKPIRSIMEAMG